MENYLLALGIGIFLGVAGLILLADRRRRANLEQFAQASQVLNEILKTLQGFHASNCQQLNELKECVLQSQTELKAAMAELHKSVVEADQSAAVSAKGMNEALRDDVRKSIEKLSSALLTATGALSKTNSELKTELVGGMRSVSDSIAKTNRDLTTAVLKEVADAAKKIEELKKSLEESIKF